MNSHDFDTILKFSVENFGPSGQIESELKEFYNICKNNTLTGNFLEIGTAHGFTFSVFSHLYENIKITIDLPDGLFGGIPLEDTKYYDGTISRNNKLSKFFNNFNGILQSSFLDETVTEVEKILGGEKLDLLFIDGDHTYDGVKSDYLKYNKFVRPGGLIAFHDIIHAPKWTGQFTCDVYKFWDELKLDKQEIIHSDISDPDRWAGIGIIIKE
jgi:hypothetical protein